MGKRSKTTELLLLALEKATDAGIYLYDFTNNMHHYAYGQPWSINRYALYQIVHRLRQRGWVETHKNEGKIIIKLTQSGKNQIAIESALKNSKWDGKWRVVVFDIPEKHRKVRDVFRHRLKGWGLISWQKSVWVSKQDITQPLREFIKELRIEDWVGVLVTNDVGNVGIFIDR